MPQAVCCQPPTTKAPVQTPATPFGICGGQSCTQTGFSPSVSPVSILPPMLDTQSFIYHQRYTFSVTDSIIKTNLKKDYRINLCSCKNLRMSQNKLVFPAQPVRKLIACRLDNQGSVVQLLLLHFTGRCTHHNLLVQDNGS